jgi:uncharacterized protein YoxC
MVGRDSRPATRQAQGTLERLRTEYEGVISRFDELTTRLTSLTEGLGGKEQTVRDLLREIEASRVRIGGRCDTKLRMYLL